MEALDAQQVLVWLEAAGALLGRHALSVVVFLPIATGLGLIGAGGLASFLLQSDGFSPRVWKGAGVVGSALTFALALAVPWRQYDPERAGMQLVEHVAWLPGLGIHYFVGVDGISLPLVVLATFLVPLVLIASWNDIDHSRRSFVFFVLSAETLALGALCSLNLFAFYAFFEAMALPMVFLVGVFGGARRIRAAVELLLFWSVGSLLLLVSMLSLVELNFQQGAVLNFDLVASAAPGLPLLETRVPVTGEAAWWKTQTWLFVGFALAFAVKVPLVPLHTWLADAHAEAPTAGSALLSGVLVTTAAYGLVRLALPLFPNVVAEDLPWLLGAAAAGAVYCALVALVQRDVLRLVAYWSAAQLAMVALGIFSADLQGVVGGVVAIVSHGLCTAGLFLIVGFVRSRRGTAELDALGGLAKPMPVFAATFGVVALAAAGVPMLSGFVGEWLVLLGAFAASPGVAVTALVGGLLAAVVGARLFGRVALGPLDDPANRGLIDLSWRERSVALALVLAVVAVGVHPEPLLRRVEPAAVELLATARQRAQTAPPQAEPTPLASLGATRPERSAP